MALAALRASGAAVDYEVVHASDFSARKISLYNAGADAHAAVSGRAPTHAEKQDLRDAAFFSPSRIASWGEIDLLVACVDCKKLSKCGKRGGLVEILGSYVRPLLRIIRRARAAQLVLECVAEIEHDPLFETELLRPLGAMGYFSAHGKICGRARSDANRDRWWYAASLSRAEWLDFDTLPTPPDRREAKLHNLLLDAALPRALAASGSPSPRDAAARAQDLVHCTRSGYAPPPPLPRPRAPLWAYDLRRPSNKDARAIASCKSLFTARGTRWSRVVNFQFKRVSIVGGARGDVTPTLTASRSAEFRVRDARGVRVLIAREIGDLHGYYPHVIDGLLSAARLAAKPSRKTATGQRIPTHGTVYASRVERAAHSIVSTAIGDGFMLFVARDILVRMIRARLRVARPAASVRHIPLGAAAERESVHNAGGEGRARVVAKRARAPGTGPAYTVKRARA